MPALDVPRRLQGRWRHQHRARSTFVGVGFVGFGVEFGIGVVCDHHRRASDPVDADRERRRR
jgi:hypothetical protein